MGKYQDAQIDKELRQIVDMLLLNGTLTECPGLLHGKIGIAIFFFHYAKYTGNDLFADYAIDLISETLNQIHVNSPADYKKGIAGIGVGIDYLIQNSFLTVEDDICEDFDKLMFRAVMYDPWRDFSQHDGLIGYGRYWITRLRYQVPALQARKCLSYTTGQIAKKNIDIPMVEQTDVYYFLSDLCQIQGFEMCKRLLTQFKKQSVKNLPLTQITDLDMEKPPASTGLLNGYAGEGMMRLTALNKANKSWMNLL